MATGVSTSDRTVSKDECEFDELVDAGFIHCSCTQYKSKQRLRRMKPVVFWVTIVVHPVIFAVLKPRGVDTPEFLNVALADGRTSTSLAGVDLNVVVMLHMFGIA